MSASALSAILTFLFTDLENSTPLWEQHPDLMQGVSARHDELLRSAFEAHSGRVVKTTGDGFHVVFGSPADGIEAALAAQQAIAAEDWPEEIGHIRVRMGLHAGESRARKGDFYGPEINRAARVMGIAHGGQILVSNAAAALLRGRLPDEAELIDLGPHRLRGLSDSEQIYQLAHPALKTDFPPLQAAVSIPHNLPGQLTSFIGRARELAEVKRLLEGHRLLTLLGPGGTGKTRLMLQAAGELLESFPDGVWLVELAPLTKPELVAEQAASVFGVRGQPDRTLAESLALYLRRKETLLLLDNAEHLIQASAELAAHLLTLCPGVKILVTSREPLAIRGETIFDVPALSIPAKGVKTEAELGASEAAQLFIERARAVRLDFELTDHNAPSVAEIIQQLDGIPLALELAAARMRVMTAEQIAARLNDRFKLLVSGRRTALPRQQTLQTLIDWSWNLLEDREQTLLRRLSLFSGGWSLEDAQQVAHDSQLDEFEILDGLDGLVHKSLVTTEPPANGTIRFSLLETIRQYAWERLLESGEAEAFSERHAAYFAALVREADSAKIQAETMAWIERLLRETDNFRVAFDWLEIHDPMLLLATTGKLMILGLQGFWQGFWSFSPSQARRWLERAIEIGRKVEVREEDRQDHHKDLAIALSALAINYFALGRHEEGAAAGAEAVSILRPLGESQDLAYALGSFAFNLGFLGRLDEAFESGQEAREIAGRHGGGVALSIALAALGLAALVRGDYENTHHYLEEGKAALKELGSSGVGPQVLVLEGQLLALTGDLERAEAIYREATARFEALREQTQTAITRSELAHMLRGQGKWEQALPLYRETILFFQDMGHEPAVANQLECFAYIAIVREQPVRAARLLGTAQVIRERTQNPLFLPWEKAEFDQALQHLGEILGVASLDAAVGEGRSMTLDEAVAYARAGTAG